MNAFRIKIIAILAMIVDHFALFFFPASIPLQIIGRLSFPLIAWLIANGAMHTKNIDRYILRILIFAAISQIPYELGFWLHGKNILFLNVLFTLTLGLIAIRILRTPQGSVLKAAGVSAAIAAGYFLNVDYGALGVLTIVVFYILYDRPALMIAAQAVIYVGCSNIGAFEPSLARIMNMHPMQEYAVLALPIILLYNGMRGVKAQYFFYWFFPLQAFAYLILSIVTR